MMARKMFGVLVYSVEEISHETGLNSKTLQLMCRTGEIKARKIGREYWVLKADLEEFLGFEIPEEYETKAERESTFAAAYREDMDGAEEAKMSKEEVG